MKCRNGNVLERGKNNVLIVIALTISPSCLPKQQPRGEKTLRIPDLLSFLVKYLLKEFGSLLLAVLCDRVYSLKYIILILCNPVE